MRSQGYWLSVVWLVASLAGVSFSQSYDPPASYYSTATGTGTTLKSQLHNIIDDHTVMSYNSARTSLQVTDADPAKPGHMLTVYDRTSLNVAAINPGDRFLVGTTRPLGIGSILGHEAEESMTAGLTTATCSPCGRR